MIPSHHKIRKYQLCGTTSRRFADRKVENFDKNIVRRGSVPQTFAKKGKNYPVGPVMLGFFVFVVVGSSLFQIIRTATSGGMSFMKDINNIIVKSIPMQSAQQASNLSMPW
ncbi:hypothetical protein L2E82_13347 [Cichorium intybus]|uniref:Uncharacterized protein n=1 Tax=Cichorium intybus TaxID=13427 RepID=A0ACB9EYH0_CICIN|nr:hypothetical protein L2E82_13347 [Cichorium intybus]